MIRGKERWRGPTMEVVVFFQFGATHVPFLNSLILLRSENTDLRPLLLDRIMA